MDFTLYKLSQNMTETREWLLLNAVECWLYHYSSVGKFTDDYIKLRDELRQAVKQTDTFTDNKDAAEIQSKPTPRKRTSKAS